MYRRRMSRAASCSLYRRTARRVNVANLRAGLVPRGGQRL